MGSCETGLGEMKAGVSLLSTLLSGPVGLVQKLLGTSKHIVNSFNGRPLSKGKNHG